ncbi:MAG: class I SAM-dependent methyltransferase [Dehalococcoidales bacterium]|nr:class I SAM-dependent methyltransferase [Dehalococcoidales bacterium]
MAQWDNVTPSSPQQFDGHIENTISHYQDIQTEIIDLVLTIKPYATVWLDTGCGTGSLIEMALPYFPKTQFLLVDPTETMLQVAQNKLKHQPEERIRFLPPTGSENLGHYKDNLKAQVITAVLCHHYFTPDQRKIAVKTCFDLLEPEGVFVTVEHSRPRTKRGIEIMMDRWRRFQTNHGRKHVEEHLQRFDSHYFPITLNEHIQMLENTGFRTVEIFWFSLLDVGLYAIK